MATNLLARLAVLPPEEAVAYMQARGLLTPTFDWRDLWQEEHAAQFTVSRLARLDLLQAMYDGITLSVKGELGRRDFLRGIKDILVTEGWWGEKEAIDPKTGEKLLTTFDADRLKLIYDINTRQAYAAGQWQRIERNAATSPYIRYVTKRDERVRASHRAWDNVTLPVGHPFWDTHTPMNGWRCRCRIVSLSQAEYDKGLSPTGKALVKDAPPEEFVGWENKKTGEITQVSKGIDPGFDYNPGKAAMRAANLEKVAQDKLARVAGPIRKEAEKDFADNGGMKNTRANSEAIKFVSSSLEKPRSKQKPYVLGSIEDAAITRASLLGVDLIGKRLALDHDGIIHTIKKHGGESEMLRGQEAITPDDIALFQDLFNAAELKIGDPSMARDGTKLIEGIVSFDGYLYTVIAKVRRMFVVPFTMHKSKLK